MQDNMANLTSKKVAFTSAEKELLVSLVAERPIIEEKKTNAYNITKKKEAWEDLEDSFNSQPYVSKRTAMQLKRCWENIKSLRKRELSQEAASYIRTGGGPPDVEAGPSNIVDSICPFINLTVPGVIDSNTPVPEIEVLAGIEANEYDEVLGKNNEAHNTVTPMVKFTTKEGKRKIDFDSAGSESFISPDHKRRNIGTHKIKSEIECRINRVMSQISQDREMHNLRMEREKVLTEKETVALKREQYTAEAERKKYELLHKKIEIEIKLLECSLEKLQNIFIDTFAIDHVVT